MLHAHVADMHAATAAKEAGSNAFRGGQFSEALRFYTDGIRHIVESDELSDYGLLKTMPRSPTLDLPTEQQALLATLLTNRAAAALRIGRVCRALADTSLAHALAPSAKTSYRRAQALLSIGACSAARAVLAPFVDAEPDLMKLSASTELRANRVAGLVAELEAAPNAARTVPDDLAYVGPMELRRLVDDETSKSSGGGTVPGGMRGRGWFATERIPAGTLLLVEPAVFPLAPLSRCQTRCPSRRKSLRASPNLVVAPRAAPESGGNGAGARRGNVAEMRDLLACMHPVPGVAEDAPTRRDTDCLPVVESIAADLGLSTAEVASIDRKVQRNQMSLTMRVYGESVEFGTGLFPLASLLNHSCDASASFQPLCSGHLMVTRALRDIDAGEEVCDSYVRLTMPGEQRRASLRRTHGFVCRCSRCAAPEGSPLHELERRGARPRLPRKTSDRRTPWRR